MTKVVGDIAVTIGADIGPLQSGLYKGSSAVDKFGNKIDAMGRKVKRAGAEANRMGGVMGRLSNVSNRTRAQIQNASFQFQDLAVQIQGGTKASTALAQQLPQLLGGFGAVGAVMGVLAGVGIPALASAFGDAFEQSKSFEDAMNDLSSAIDNYRASIESSRLSTAKMIAEFGTASPLMQQLLQDFVALGRFEAFDRLDETIKGLVASIGLTEKSLKRVFSLEGSRREVRDQADEIKYQLKVIEASTISLGERLAKAIDIRRKLIANAGGINGMNKEQREFLNLLTSAIQKMEILTAITDRAEQATSGITQAMYTSVTAINDAVSAAGGLEGIIGGAANRAWDLAKGLAAAAANARTAIGDPTGAPVPEFVDGEGGGANPIGWQFKRTSGGGSRGGGGGGGPSRDWARELADLKAKFATEAETIQTEYEKQLELLAEFRANKIATEQEFNDLEQRIEADHQEKMANIDQKARDNKLSAYKGALGDLSGLMQTENKKLFKVGQVAAVAQATIDGLQAAVTAHKKGMEIGGPVTAGLFAAASLAKTGAMISQIKSATPSGGGSSVGAASAASAVTQTPLQVSLSGIDREQLYSGGDIEDLLDRLIDAGGDRGLQIASVAA